MELYDNQRTSTPLTAKTIKSPSAVRQMGFFHFEAPPPGDHDAQRSNPKYSKQSYFLLLKITHTRNQHETKIFIYLSIQIKPDEV